MRRGRHTYTNKYNNKENGKMGMIDTSCRCDFGAAMAPEPAMAPEERYIAEMLSRIESAEARLDGMAADARIARREINTARQALADIVRGKVRRPAKEGGHAL